MHSRDLMQLPTYLELRPFFEKYFLRLGIQARRSFFQSAFRSSAIMYRMLCFALAAARLWALTAQADVIASHILIIPTCRGDRLKPWRQRLLCVQL